MIDEELVREFPHYATLEIIKLDRSTGISDILDISVMGDMMDWCMDSMGRSNFHFGWEYPTQDSKKYYRIRFRHGSDANAFALVWGGYINHDLA